MADMTKQTEQHEELELHELELIEKILNADPQTSEVVMNQLLSLAEFCAYKMTTQSMIDARNIARNFFERTIRLLD